MKRDRTRYSKDTELMDCVNSAYNDLQILLKDSFINLSRLPYQLTLVQFSSLFICYDWQDIFNSLEELENLPSLTGIRSVSHILKKSLIKDQIAQIANPRENTYYKVWAGIITDEDFH